MRAFTHTQLGWGWFESDRRMLIRGPILEQIRAGKVTLAFRRWRRPTVKAGGTLKTAVGVLKIQRVEVVALESVTESDARNAGHSTLAALLEEIHGREGQTYRIELAYAGGDPRIALREIDDLKADELDAIVSRLHRMDALSPTGSWTEAVLAAIDDHPMAPAAALASHTGIEKERLKTSIRKLKNLGLTISHQPGYELSPRGRFVLNHLRKDA